MPSYTIDYTGTLLGSDEEGKFKLNLTKQEYKALFCCADDPKRATKTLWKLNFTQILPKWKKRFMEMNSKKENGKAGSSLLPCASCGSSNDSYIMGAPRIVHSDDYLTCEIIDNIAIPCCHSEVCHLRAGQILKPSAEAFEEGTVNNRHAKKRAVHFVCKSCFSVYSTGGGHHEDDNPMMVCGGCKAVYYCSRSCQVKDWNKKPNGHKQFCKEIQKLDKKEKEEKMKKRQASKSTATTATATATATTLKNKG